MMEAPNIGTVSLPTDLLLTLLKGTERPCAIVSTYPVPRDAEVVAVAVGPKEGEVTVHYRTWQPIPEGEPMLVTLDKRQSRWRLLVAALGLS